MRLDFPISLGLISLSGLLTAKSLDGGEYDYGNYEVSSERGNADILAVVKNGEKASDLIGAFVDDLRFKHLINENALGEVLKKVNRWADHHDFDADYNAMAHLERELIKTIGQHCQGDLVCPYLCIREKNEPMPKPEHPNPVFNIDWDGVIPDNEGERQIDIGAHPGNYEYTESYGENEGKDSKDAVPVYEGYDYKY